MFKKLLTVVAVLAAFMAVTLTPAVTAATASLSFNPSTATVINGDSLAVAVRVNTNGESVNAVQANLTYPADKFDLVSISYSGTAFTIEAESYGSGGTVRMGRGNTTAVSGNLLVGTLNLKAKVSSGQAVLSFSGDSAVVRSSDNANIIGGNGTGTYTFSAPAAPAPTPPPPSSTTTTPPPSSSNTSNSSTPSSNSSSSGSTGSSGSSGEQPATTTSPDAIATTSEETEQNEGTLTTPAESGNKKSSGLPVYAWVAIGLVPLIAGGGFVFFKQWKLNRPMSVSDPDIFNYDAPVNMPASIASPAVLPPAQPGFQAPPSPSQQFAIPGQVITPPQPASVGEPSAINPLNSPLP